MCGITGKVSLVGKKVTDSEIERMNESIVHRGPDDGGVWVEGSIGLGNRRLAVIDLSAAGHMPMMYAKDRYVITYNGEFYNFSDRKKQLEKKGYRFKSHSDTEVILALYQEYGVKCLEHIRGMFAFAIYDRKEKVLFIARDRLGKKPLKYYMGKNVFIFGSELKAILTQKEVRAEPDILAIHHYLSFGYVPAPMTGFRGINKLEPGHYLIFDTKTNTLVKNRYWRPEFKTNFENTEEEWKDQIWKKVVESTKLRMIADVPVGAFLSGGVDSSAVVAAMSSLSKKPVKTFSIGYKEQAYDETKYARLVADRFQTEHTTLWAQPESVEILPELVRQYEEPFADSSMVVTYLVSRLARQYVTVALNGDGGDENFAGYGRYNKQKWYGLLNQMPIISSSQAKNLVGWIAKKTNDTTATRLERIWNKLIGDPAYRYLVWNCYFLPEEKNELYKKEFVYLTTDNSSSDLLATKMEQAKTDNLGDQALYADLTNYLPEDLLVKVDIASMAVSLEARSPLLDHEFVEMACKIPFDLKVKGWGQHKYIFKESLRGVLPNEVLDRPKMGFSMPLELWFKNELNKYASSVLLKDSRLTKHLVKKEVVSKMLNEHSEQKDYGPKLWSLLTLELWWRAFFE